MQLAGARGIIAPKYVDGKGQRVMCTVMELYVLILIVHVQYNHSPHLICLGLSSNLHGSAGVHG